MGCVASSHAQDEIVDLFPTFLDAHFVIDPNGRTSHLELSAALYEYVHKHFKKKPPYISFYTWNKLINDLMTKTANVRPCGFVSLHASEPDYSNRFYQGLYLIRFP